MRPAFVLIAFIASAAYFLVQAHAQSEEKSPSPQNSDKGQTNAPSKSGADTLAEKYWQALKLLESGNPADLPSGRDALEAAANLEYTHAQTLLAECLLTGQYGFTINKRKAANLYRLAAARGNGFAQVSLGQCYFSETGVWKNTEKAAEWLKAGLSEKADYSKPVPPPEIADFFASQQTSRSKVAGDLANDPAAECRAIAHYYLGLICSGDNKMAEAQAHFVTSANMGVDGRSGVYQAAVQAAVNYAFGRGVPRDLAMANQMLGISRKLNIRSGFRMVHHYATTKFVDDFATGDLETSVTENSDKIQTSLQIEIAEDFIKESSKDYNPAEAAKWYELAANNGNPWAMVQLALLHSGNQLGKPEPEKAFMWFEKAGGGDKPKHALGLANYAICLLRGIGTAADHEKAEATFKRFMRKDFVCYLGSIGSCPSSPLTEKQYLSLLETWAKKRKDPAAQYFLGLRYLEGWQVKPDIETAIRWFEKSAKAGNGTAWCMMGYLHEQRELIYFDWEERINAFECYKRGCKAGDPDAMTRYATLLSSWKTVDDPEFEQARLIYLKCLEIDPENPGANNNLALIYKARANDSRSLSVREDTAAMFKYLEAALKEHTPEAASNLSSLYSDDVLVPRDYQKAYSYLEMAADFGMAEAHLALGKANENGSLGVPISYTEAAYHYRLAALGGNKQALRCLVDFYISGKAGSVDLDRATFWLERMMQEGDSLEAATTMVDIMINRHQYESAVEILNRLNDDRFPAETGFACERLSQCYENGWGVRVDKAKAKQFFEKALAYGDGAAMAKHGVVLMSEGKFGEAIATFERASSQSSEACYYLGQLYFFGNHVETNKSKALDLMRKAARQNHNGAMYFLAGATFNHEPDAPPIEEAIRLAAQAEVNGYPKAASLREKLEKRLNSERPKDDKEDSEETSCSPQAN